MRKEKWEVVDEKGRKWKMNGEGSRADGGMG